MEAIKDDYFFFASGQWHRVNAERHYCGKDFSLEYRTSPVHGWRGVREMTREQATELRDMLSLALQEWTYER